jgi:hypothetical protein
VTHIQPLLVILLIAKFLEEVRQHLFNEALHLVHCEYVGGVGESAVPWRVLHLLPGVGEEAALWKVPVNTATLPVTLHLVASHGLALYVSQCLHLNSSQSVSRNLA